MSPCGSYFSYKVYPLKQINLPGFIQSLQDKDLGHLRIIAERWGIEFNAASVKDGLHLLARVIEEPGLIGRVIDELPREAKDALKILLEDEGVMLWATFIRRFGDIREIGPGRRDRERPDKTPISAAETLWYRGIIARAFFDWQKGLEEFVYIPLEIFRCLPKVEHAQIPIFGRFAIAEEMEIVYLAQDLILDHACTYLAARRAEFEDFELIQRWIGFGFPLPLSIQFMNQLLSSAGLIDVEGKPQGGTVRPFLEKPRDEALKTLVDTWLSAADLNEMALVPGLELEGVWKNDPLSARKALIELIGKMPDQFWHINRNDQEAQKASHQKSKKPFISITSFISAVKEHHPDIQRSAGDYDASYIKDLATGEFLRGFQNWELVEGRLIHYLICGPMHWLGLVDLASGNGGPDHITAFRVSAFGEYIYRASASLPVFVSEDEEWLVEMSGIIHVPRLSSRAGRYLISRFCAWEICDENVYRYLITPVSLQKARQQGLQISQVILLIKKFAKNQPPNLLKALDRWETKGSEVLIDQYVILRVKNPEILIGLRSSRAARFLGEPLGRYAVTIQKGAIKQIREVLNEMGYLSEINLRD